MQCYMIVAQIDMKHLLSSIDINIRIIPKYQNGQIDQFIIFQTSFADLRCNAAVFNDFCKNESFCAIYYETSPYSLHPNFCDAIFIL